MQAMLDLMLPFMLGMGVIFAGVLVFAYVVKMREVGKARTWKVTTGRITRSAVRAVTRKDLDGKSIRENAPDVVYEYAVNGRRYTGARISFAERISGDDLEAALQRYPLGQVVQVTYNPLKPSEAVLEREMPAAVGFGVSMLAVFVIVGALLIPFSLGTVADWLSPRLPDPERAPFVALVGALGLFTFVIALAVQREAWATRDWQTAPGRIIGSEAEEYRAWVSDSSNPRLRTFYRPTIVYLFSVNGRDYIGDRITFGGQAGWSASIFFRYRLARYPEGSQVTVYYNPANPSEAVLERRAFGLWLLVGAGAALLALAGVAAGLF